MLYSFDECIKKYNNLYQIEKMIQSGKLYKIDRGVYSDKKQVSELEVVAFKYPNAVFAMDSAFYYHGLTDVIPDVFHLATNRDAAKIRSTNVIQVFYRDTIFPIGVDSIFYQNVMMRIYDKERMLIELIRNKSALPFDYYKEIIESYRKITQDLDIEKLQDYIMQFSKKDHIMNAIRLEVL